jgi:hypothetical protein
MIEGHVELVMVETGQPGRFVNITNTRQIEERLTQQWPVARRGAAYHKAVEACLDHLQGKKEASAVRKAFIEAAKEADIFVCEGTHYE